MQTSALPSRMPTPFADTGTKNTIPVASQVGITAGAASFTTGFPPLTMTPVAAGGVPPFGADFNGILNAITQAVRWTNAGMAYPFDTAFSTSIGGYPKGALVPNSTFSGYWYNTVDQNTAAPEAADASTTGWVPLMNTGFTSVSLASSSVTLTSLQAAKDRIVLSGTLTANVSLYLPAWTRRWIIVNNCTGPFAVTVSTQSGSGVAIPTAAAAEIYGDGTNIALAGPFIAVTPPALDASGRVANTQWVTKNGIRSSGLQMFGSAQTLTPDHVGATILFNNAGGSGASYSATLPSQASCPDGSVLRITCNLVAGYLLTLNCQGSDKLTTPNANPSSIVMQAGDTLELTSQAGGYWVCTGGSAFLSLSARFAASFATTGYSKGGNGIIEQWTTLVTNSNGDGTFTLPTAFPNALLGWEITVNASSANSYTATKAAGSQTQLVVKTSSGGSGAALSVTIRVWGN